MGKPTSTLAHRSMVESGEIEILHERILKALSVMPDQSGTAYTIATQMGTRKEIIGKRMHELVKLEKVIETGQLQKTDTGRLATVYQLKTETTSNHH